MNWDVSRNPMAAETAAFDAESARRFMASVYRWMFGGLLLTAGVAFYTMTSEPLLLFAVNNFLLLALVQLGLVLGFGFLLHRVSAAAAGAMFLAYSFLTGLFFAPIFLRYELGSVGQVFAITAGTFGAMSVYGTVTKKDLTGWRSFLMMGLFGILIAAVVNIFVGSSAVSFVVSCASVVVFTGLTAYDTQKLRAMHAQAAPGSEGRLAIYGALTLYLDFINLFLALLRLLGRRR